MSRKALILLCMLPVAILCACSKSETEEKLAKEEQTLADYIAENFPNAISLGGGAYLVKTHEEENGAAVEAGNYILWNRDITNQITGELEYTSKPSASKFDGSYVDGGPEITLVQSYIVDEGLKNMKKGEKGDIYVPSRWLYVDFQPRVFSVEIVSVIRDLSIYQESLMSGYIKRQTNECAADTVKAVSTVDNTEHKVMYRIIEQGAGDIIAAGANVDTKTSISYLIRENDVRRYVTDKDRTWYTTAGEKINTLTKTNCTGEILGKMTKGGRAIIAMPSKLLWEDKNLPQNDYGQYYIPKWSVVVFTVTVK